MPIEKVRYGGRVYEVEYEIAFFEGRRIKAIYEGQERIEVPLEGTIGRKIMRKFMEALEPGYPDSFA